MHGMNKRFYAENSEYPRVIDTRSRHAVFVGEAYGYEAVKRVCDAMNRTWERDVEFVAEWLSQIPIADENDEPILLDERWREEMGGE
jgi:hypothetical protein